MKNDLYLKLNGEIAPLTSNEENQLKGGFGILDILDVKLYDRNFNTNCTQGSNNNNTNCGSCTCNSTSPGTGVTPATW